MVKNVQNVIWNAEFIKLGSRTKQTNRRRFFSIGCLRMIYEDDSTNWIIENPKEQMNMKMGFKLIETIEEHNHISKAIVYTNKVAELKDNI